MPRRLLLRGSALLLLTALALGAAWLLAGQLQTSTPPDQAAGPPLPEPTWTYVVVSDWPAAPRPEVLYIGIPAGESAPAAAMLLCPCGCGDSVRISLREQDDPHWYFSADEAGRPTLTPSIWRNRGCRSHFTLGGGVVSMIPEPGPDDVD